MQALPKCCLLGRTLASGGQQKYPRYQSSSPFQDCCFSRSREARDSARATLQAMTLAWEEQWPKCTMSHDTSPLAISDTLEASTGPGRSSSSRRKGCTPLLQPWCQQEQTGHLAKHWQPEFGTCLALSAGITSPQLFVDSRTARKSDKTRPRRSCLLQFLQQSLYRPAVPPSRQ